jgi:acyl-homoserine lactone acylase PvdQ
VIRFVAAALLVLSAAPAYAQDAADEVADLWSEVTLYRDEWGVPHVYADNPRAMAFAFGYAQAEDHLAAMLMAYRLANGRASEVLGEETETADRPTMRSRTSMRSRAVSARASRSASTRGSSSTPTPIRSGRTACNPRTFLRCCIAIS